MNEPFDLIRSVRLTEKATLLSEKLKTSTFLKSARAQTNFRSKRRYELLMKKKVIAVNTMNYAGKLKAPEARRRPGRTVHWKKAIVTLAPARRSTSPKPFTTFPRIWLSKPAAR